MDRRSFAGAYKMVNGIPRNPLRRTGITGRGVLGRWGPNHLLEVVISRWRLAQPGAPGYHPADGGALQIVKQNNMPMLEVLVLHGRDGKTRLPTCIRHPLDVLPPLVEDFVGPDHPQVEWVRVLACFDGGASWLAQLKCVLRASWHACCASRSVANR